MSEIRFAANVAFEDAPLVIVGAGAAGLCAALSAHETGAEVVVVERDAVPSGSTGLSAGLIPAAGTRFQRAKGIDDDAARFAADIQRKNSGESDAAFVSAVCAALGPAIEWLAARYGFPFEVIADFNYPGHSVHRMHGLPSRSGAALVDRLRAAAEQAGITILTNAPATALYVDDVQRVRGIACRRGDREEIVGCAALVLACNGYGGNRDLVHRFIPEMGEATYAGHPGNQGDAVLWGETLGAGLRSLTAYQGHGSLATPHNILITWAVITEGGFQLNAEGRRFSNETSGYSEQAAVVLQQPGGIAYDVFDARVAAIARQFPDFRVAESTAAVMTAATVADLAARLRVPRAVLEAEFAAVETLIGEGGRDRFGRSFAGVKPLTPPYYAVKVTGALFHTQGGLAVKATGQVCRDDGSVFPNLFAAGGAAMGLSGNTAKGYLSGNGLLSAVVLGRLAGRAAAKVAASAAPTDAAPDPSP